MLLDEIELCNEDISLMKDKGYIYADGEHTEGTIKISFVRG